MGTRDIELLIKARDEASKVFAGVANNAQRMQQQIGMGGGVFGGLGSGGEGFVGQLKSITQIGGVIGGVKAALSAVGAVSGAIRGDWEAVTEALKRLPFGLGELASIFEQIYNRVSGTAEGIERFQGTLQEIDRHAKKLDVVQGIRRAADAEVKAAGMSGDELAIQALRDKFGARIAAINENSAGLGAGAVLGAKASAQAAMRTGITKLHDAAEQRIWDDLDQELLASQKREVDQQEKLRTAAEAVTKGRIAEAEAIAKSVMTDEERLAAEKQRIAGLVREGLLGREAGGRALTAAQEEFGPTPPAEQGARGLWRGATRFLGWSQGGGLSDDAPRATARNTAETTKAVKELGSIIDRQAAAMDKVAALIEATQGKTVKL